MTGFQAFAGQGQSLSQGRLSIIALALVSLSSSLLPAQAADPDRELRLLVPLDTGADYGRLVNLYPEAELLKRKGRDYLQLGLYNDARQAYRAGRRMQQSMPLRFVITYPVNHPQANGRWIAAEEAAEASSARDAAAARAQELQIAERAASQARAAQLGPSLEVRNPLLAISANPQAVTAKPADSPVLLAAAVAPRGLLDPRPEPEQMHAPVQESRSQQIDPPAPKPAWVSKPESTRPSEGSDLALAAPRVSRMRSSLVAFNPELVYLFAELASAEDLQVLRKRMIVSEVVERDGKLLAQVGIFTTSRIGRQLRRQLEDHLNTAGYRPSQLGPV